MSEQLPSLTGSRPILTLKNRPRRTGRETPQVSPPPPPATPSSTSRRAIRPVARWSSDYTSRMQAEMDALR
ncbi:MAG TPA: hypothetical protein VHV81_10660 [Steroidobacteraceae bacterium]|jgi:hypothetical protein|nr:hypothetical protein [Steroidobacteraceae bacterium]